MRTITLRFHKANRRTLRFGFQMALPTKSPRLKPYFFPKDLRSTIRARFR